MPSQLHFAVAAQTYKAPSCIQGTAEHTYTVICGHRKREVLGNEHTSEPIGLTLVLSNLAQNFETVTAILRDLRKLDIVSDRTPCPSAGAARRLTFTGNPTPSSHEP